MTIEARMYMSDGGIVLDQWEQRPRLNHLDVALFFAFCRQHYGEPERMELRAA